MRNWSIFRHLRTRRVAALLLAAAMMYGTLPVAYAQESTLIQQEIIAQVTSGSGVTSENDVESAESTSESQAAPESVAESVETASSSEAAPESVAESAETASSSEAASESVAESTETASSSEAAPESVAESATVDASSNELHYANQMASGDPEVYGDFEYVEYTTSTGEEGIRILRYTGDRSAGKRIVFPHTIAAKPVLDAPSDLLSGIQNLILVYEYGSTKLLGITRGASVQSITIPNTAKEVERFDGCSENTAILFGGKNIFTNGKLVVPEGIESFFCFTPVEHIVLPKSIKSFAQSGIKTMEFAYGVERIPTIRLAGETLIIPDTVRHIGDPQSYEGYSGSTFTKVLWGGNNILENGKLTLPEGLETLCNGFLKNNENIQHVVIPSTIKYMRDVPGASSGVVLEFAEGIKRIESHWVSSDSKISKVILPESVYEIQTGAFSDSSLSEINLENVHKIGFAAFSNCDNLKEVELSGFVSALDQAFLWCDNLEKVVLNGSVYLSDNSFETNPKVVLYSAEGSRVQEQAKEQGIPFQVLNTSPGAFVFDKNFSGTITAGAVAPFELVTAENKIFTQPLIWEESENIQFAYSENGETKEGELLRVIFNPGDAVTLTVKAGDVSKSCTVSVERMPSGTSEFKFLTGLLLQPGQVATLQAADDVKDEFIKDKELDWEIVGSSVVLGDKGTVTAKKVGSNSLYLNNFCLGYDQKNTLGSGLQDKHPIFVVEDKNFVDNISYMGRFDSGKEMEDSVWSYRHEGADQLEVTVVVSSTVLGDIYIFDKNGRLVQWYDNMYNNTIGNTITISGDSFSIYCDVKEGQGDDSTDPVKVFDVKSVKAIEFPDQITSDEYPIDENKNISGIQPGASLESIQKDLVGQNIKAFDAKGKPVAASAPLGTGYVLTMGSFGDENQLTVVVSGDIDGDAKVAVADTIYMKQTMMGSRVLEGAYQKAATFKSGSQEGPSVLDFTTMKQFMLGKISALK